MMQPPFLLFPSRAGALCSGSKLDNGIGFTSTGERCATAEHKQRGQPSRHTPSLPLLSPARHALFLSKHPFRVIYSLSPPTWETKIELIFYYGPQRRARQGNSTGHVRPGTPLGSISQYKVDMTPPPPSDHPHPKTGSPEWPEMVRQCQPTEQSMLNGVGVPNVFQMIAQLIDT